MATIEGGDIVEEAMATAGPAIISARGRLPGRISSVRNGANAADANLCDEEKAPHRMPSEPQLTTAKLAPYQIQQQQQQPSPCSSTSSPGESHELAMVPYMHRNSDSDQIFLEQQPQFVLTNLKTMGSIPLEALRWSSACTAALTISHDKRSAVGDLEPAAQDRMIRLMNSEPKQESLTTAHVKRRKSRRHQAWSGSIEQMTSFVEAAAAHIGQDLMIVDEELSDRAAGLVERTEALRLEADVHVSGRGGVRLRSRRDALPKTHSPGDVAASVTLSVNCRALERVYIDGANRRRRRPLIVFELGDALIEASLQAYCRLHEEAEKHNTPIWQRPMLVLTIDATSKRQLALLANLQQQLRSLEKRAQIERSSALLEAVQSVVIIDPTLVMSGVASDVSAALLRSVLKRPSASGIRLIQHLAARADSIKLRVHKQGGGDDLGVRNDLGTKEDDFHRRQALADAGTQCNRPHKHSRLSIKSPPASPIFRKEPMAHRGFRPADHGLRSAAHRLVC